MVLACAKFTAWCHGVCGFLSSLNKKKVNSLNSMILWLDLAQVTGLFLSLRDIFIYYIVHQMKISLITKKSNNLSIKLHYLRWFATHLSQTVFVCMVVTEMPQMCCCSFFLTVVVSLLRAFFLWPLSHYLASWKESHTWSKKIIKNRLKLRNCNTVWERGSVRER